MAGESTRCTGPRSKSLSTLYVEPKNLHQSTLCAFGEAHSTWNIPRTLNIPGEWPFRKLFPWKFTLDYWGTRGLPGNAVNLKMREVLAFATLHQDRTTAHQICTALDQIRTAPHQIHTSGQAHTNKISSKMPYFAVWVK